MTPGICVGFTVIFPQLENFDVHFCFNSSGETHGVTPSKNKDLIPVKTTFSVAGGKVLYGQINFEPEPAKA